MPSPKPPSPLVGACSVIFDNTLYVYTPQAFQAISLTKGAEWTTLPMGNAVTGAVCVGSTPTDKSKAAFFVVGGTGGAESYQGLQRYTYATGKWDAVDMTGKSVTQDRVMHGAVYIPGSNTILMYAGAQDGSKYASTTTFTIGASEPFEVRSIAVDPTMPPAINPVLVPWSATQAAFIGGNYYNRKVMVFSTTDAWQDSGATLADAVYKNGLPIQATFMTADDGSKHLLTFDLSQAPNRVDRFMLVNADGKPLQYVKALARRHGVSRARTRQQSRKQPRQQPVRALTAADFPAYNGTLAPMTTRSDPSLATGQNGQVVIAGGNADDPLCIFDVRTNSWVNATSLFADQKSLATTPDPITSPTSSNSSSGSSLSSTPSSLVPSTPSDSSASASTSSISAQPNTTTSDGATAPDADKNTNTYLVLGGVLGSVFGLAIVLFALYWCIRSRRRHINRANHAPEGPCPAGAACEKAAMEFGISKFPQPPTGQFRGHFRGHQTQDSADSLSSMAILMGRGGDVKAGLAASGNKRESSESVFRAFKSTISKPILQDQQPVARTLRSSNLMPTKAWALNRPSLNMTEGDEKGVTFASDTVEPRPRDGPLDRGDGETRRSSGWNRYWSGGSALNLLGFGNGGDKNTTTIAAPNPSPNSNRTLVDSASSFDDENRQDSATVPTLTTFPNQTRASLSRVATGSPTLAQVQGFHATPQRAGIENGNGDDSSVVSDDISHYSSGISTALHPWDPTDAHGMAGSGWAVPSRGLGESSLYTASVYTSASGPATQPVSPRPGVPSGLSTQPQLAVAAVQGDVSWFNLGEEEQGRL